MTKVKQQVCEGMSGVIMCVRVSGRGDEIKLKYPQETDFFFKETDFKLHIELVSHSKLDRCAKVTNMF